MNESSSIKEFKWGENEKKHEERRRKEERRKYEPAQMLSKNPRRNISKIERNEHPSVDSPCTLYVGGR
jgi:hypothetical protein